MLVQQSILDQYFERRELSPAESFVKEGQYSKHIGYIKSGLLRSFQINHKGEEITTNFFTVDSFCGSFFSFYRQAPALDNVLAITKCEIYTIRYDKLHSLFNESLIFNQVGRFAIEKVCIEKDIRLSKMLKLDAQGKYEWFIQAYPSVIEQSPLKFIASFLGMKPESLSRIRKNLIS